MVKKSKCGSVKITDEVNDYPNTDRQEKKKQQISHEMKRQITDARKKIGSD